MDPQFQHRFEAAEVEWREVLQLIRANKDELLPSQLKWVEDVWAATFATPYGDMPDDYYNGVKWLCQHCDTDGGPKIFKLTEAGELPQEVKDDLARGHLFTICEKCVAVMHKAGTYPRPAAIQRRN